MENPNEFSCQWAILPAPVRYDKDLPPNAKLLFAEIAAKTNTLGYCWAYNSYFAERLALSPDRVSDLISRLEKGGYIEIQYDRDKTNTEKRKIFCTAKAFAAVGGIGENADTPSRQKHRDRPGENTETGIGENTEALKENNKYKIKNKMGPERPKYMALDIFKAISAWCGSDGELLLAWMQYADMRQRTRHPIGTVATVERACQKIEKLSQGDRAYKLGLLHKATDASWRGFFPLSRDDEGFAPSPAAPERSEEAIEWLN